MSIRLCACPCIYVYIHIYVYIYTRMYAHVYMYIYIYICIYIYACMHLYIYICIYMCIWIYTHTHTHTHTRTVKACDTTNKGVEWRASTARIACVSLRQHTSAYVSIQLTKALRATSRYSPYRQANPSPCTMCLIKSFWRSNTRCVDVYLYLYVCISI
jgi:hypothetical protein